MIELGGERLGDSADVVGSLEVTGDDKTLFSMSSVRAKYDGR